VSLSTSALGYNGVLHEAAGSWQILGNGYRVYNPVLMRFHSPDDMSPFGKGGLNAYGYCQLDPINQVDPSGHWSLNVFAANLLGFRLRTPLVALVVAATAGALSAVGLAAASKNDTQRALSITAAVMFAGMSLKLGHHAWVKRKPAAATPVGAPAATPVPTPLTASAPPITPPTPTAPAVATRLSAPARLGSPGLSSRVAPSSPPANVAIQRAQPRRRAFVSSDLPPPPPPPSPSALRTRDRQRVSLRVREANIRQGSARWEQAKPIYPV